MSAMTTFYERGWSYPTGGCKRVVSLPHPFSGPDSSIPAPPSGFMTLEKFRELIPLIEELITNKKISSVTINSYDERITYRMAHPNEMILINPDGEPYRVESTDSGTVLT